MMDKSVIHLIVGKWRTPNHSNRKASDDSHKIKEEILKQIGRKNFSKKVGDNPDIDITEDGIIILKGNGPFKNKPYFVSDIPADDYFVLRIIPINETNEVEISILVPEKELNSKDNRLMLEFISGKIYMIPNDEQLVSILIDYLTEECLNNNIQQEEDILVMLISHNNLKKDK